MKGRDPTEEGSSAIRGGLGEGGRELDSGGGCGWECRNTPGLGRVGEVGDCAERDVTRSWSGPCRVTGVWLRLDSDFRLNLCILRFSRSSYALFSKLVPSNTGSGGKAI